MAIKLITGIPGSGKSYYAVHHLLKNYFIWNESLQQYQPKEKITIITNIDSLTLDHINLDLAIKESGKTLYEFFTVPFQEKIQKKYPKIIYLLDEAQRFFPYRDKIPKETCFFFEYHRHLGVDVYIITQDKKLVSQNVTLLIENEIHAIRRSLSIMGEFRYLIKSGQEIQDRFTLRKDQKVFRVYKSMDKKEIEKVSNPFMKYIWLILLATGACLLFAWRLFFHRGVIPQNQVVPSSAIVASQPVPEVLHYLSYVRVNQNIYIHEPLTNRLFYLPEFPRPLIIRTDNRKLYTVAAKYSPDEISRINALSVSLPATASTHTNEHANR